MFQRERERESYLNENLSQDARQYAIYHIIEAVKHANDKTLNDLVKVFDIQIYLKGIISRGEKVKHINFEMSDIDYVINKKKVLAELKQIVRDNNASVNIERVFEKNLITNKDHEIFIDCHQKLGNGFETYYEVQIMNLTLRRAVQVNVS